jgi:predicted transcriptional regulator
MGMNGKMPGITEAEWGVMKVLWDRAGERGGG